MIPVEIRQRLAWFWLVFLLFAKTGLAHPPLEAGRFSVRQWTVENGFPQNSVTSILETSTGYLWFGTFGGLVRFDGVRFQPAAPAGDGGRFSQRVVCLLEDLDGSLLVGSESGGLGRVRGLDVSIVPLPGGLSRASVFDIVRDVDEVLWLGTSEGLLRFEGAQSKVFTKRDGLGGDSISAVVPDPSGGVWAGTSDGFLHRVKGDLVASEPLGEGMSAISDLLADPDGALWVATWNKGLLRLRNGRLERISAGLPRGVPQRIGQLHRDADGTLWFGASPGGVGRFANDRVEFLQFETQSYVRSVFVDREGSLWVGTDGDGLFQLLPKTFDVWTRKQGLPGDSIQTVGEDAQGVIWAGVAGCGGLVRLDSEGITSYRKGLGLPDDCVESLWPGKDGSLWVGMQSWSPGVSALQRFRNGLSEPVPGVSASVINALMEARDGTLWAGTRGEGLLRIRDGEVRVFSSKQGLPSESINSITEDRHGAIWVGTGGGLVRLAGDTVRVFSLRDGLPHNMVRGVFEDVDGNLWIGTYGGGLCLYRQGRFFTFSTRDGLRENTVSWVGEDSLGQLWFTGNQGLYSIRRSELLAAASARGTRVSPQRYGAEDGLPSSETNGSSQPSAWVGQGGKLFFATIKGLAAVVPDAIAGHHAVPPVYIEELLADGSPLGLDGRVPIPLGTRRVTVSYTAPSFAAPSRLVFRYRLLGFEGNWVDAGDRRSVSYTNLSPGEYTFQVSVRNASEDWTTLGRSLRFAIKPRFFERSTFLLGLLGVFLALGYGVHRVRMRYLEKRERDLVTLVDERTAKLAEEKARAEEALERAEQASLAKTAFFSNMSHELRTPLNAVLGFGQLLHRDTSLGPSQRESVETILRAGSHLLGLINNVLSTSKSEAGGIPVTPGPFSPRQLLEEIEEMVRLRARAKGLDLVLEVSRRLPAAVMGDAGKMRQILLNLLGNAVKFTNRGVVILKVAWNDGLAIFDVTDTGPGISKEDQQRLFAPFVQTASGLRSGEGTGLGLALSRDLARLLGGDITVDSLPGQGATFRFSLPLPEASPEELAGMALQEPRDVESLAPGHPETRVLVADSVQEGQVFLRTLLESAGFLVHTTSNSAETVEEWRRFRPHALIVDARLGGISGLSVFRTLRETEERESGHGRPRMAILVASASSSPEDERKVKAAGVDALLVKPLVPNEVFSRLGELLKLNYVYHRPGQTIRTDSRGMRVGRASLHTLSSVLAKQLREALEAGDVDHAKKVIAQVSELKPALGAELERLLKSYQFDLLERMAAPENKPEDPDSGGI